MKNIKNRLMYMATAAWLLVGSMFSTSCEDTLEGVYPNESTPSIYEFICSNNDLTQFRALIDHANLYGLAQAYGGYTCFAPTNAAMTDYMAKNYPGKSIDSLSLEEAQYMVKYHFVADTLATSDFNESRLNAVNMSKQYLQTSSVPNADSTDVVVTVNRDATIISGNNRLNNGYVHVIDKVLARPQQTVAEAVAAMPDEFSVMKNLLAEMDNEKYFVLDKQGNRLPIKLSTFFDATSDTVYTSFLAQTNEAFKEAGVSDLNSLLERLRANDLQGALTDSELLYNWLGYHCLKGRIYLKDIMESTSLITSVPSQVITVTMVVDSIYLNRFKTDRIDEDGILLSRTGDYVDYVCRDGVIHTANSEIEIIERAAYRVYWDLGDQPEIRALSGYRKAGTSVSFVDGDLSMMRWVGKNNFAITYYCSGLPEVEGSYDEKSQYVYGDQMTMRICSVNAISHMEITTPVLVAGKYNIWICWRRANPGKFNATFHHGPVDVESEYEDQFMPSNVNLEDYAPNYDDDEAKGVANGWKRYTAKKFNSVFCCKKLGAVEVHTTGAHTLIFDALVQSKGDGDYWDMIQFIPVEEDQVWPRIAMNGDLIEKGTPDCQIYPSQCAVNGYSYHEGCQYHDPNYEPEVPAE